MELFTIIEDAAAIVRGNGGVFKQSKVYHRGGRVFVGHSGGFLRVTARFGDTWGTSNPNVKVVDMSGDIQGLSIEGEPRWTA